MQDFYASYVGHMKNARRAVVKLNLAKENEISYISDGEVTEMINKSSYIVLRQGSDWALIPKELEDKITWICR